jgi:phage shock protein B
MEDFLLPVFIVGMLFIGFPWVILHYITQWKKAASITREDENLLDELHDMARRLDDRIHTVERIIAADNPNWRAKDAASLIDQIEDSRRYRADKDA